MNEVTVENAPHAVAVDALQKAGNIVRLVSKLSKIFKIGEYLRMKQKKV